ALLARREGKAALRPLNATSHWLHGPAAAFVEKADLSHTGVGYLTHHAAMLFWASLFELWIQRHRPVAPLPLLRDAMTMSAVAAFADYVLTPKRFTPGWEFVLSKRSMAATYAAMALGLAAGTLLIQHSLKRDRPLRFRS
ncbi:MAG: hypothetical protein ACRYG8_48650, partial [Janthinobacterium lividum]